MTRVLLHFDDLEQTLRLRLFAAGPVDKNNVFTIGHKLTRTMTRMTRTATRVAF